MVPKQLQKDILEENHSSGMASHFAVSHLHGGGKGCTVMCTSFVAVAHSVQQPQGEEESPSHYYIQSLFKGPFKLLG